MRSCSCSCSVFAPRAAINRSEEEIGLKIFILDRETDSDYQGCKVFKDAGEYDCVLLTDDLLLIFSVLHSLADWLRVPGPALCGVKQP